MPMLDIATYVKVHNYKTAPFQECLTELGWVEGQGVENALMLFTGMCNNGVYCPTLEIYKKELKMVWENDDHYVIVFVDRYQDILKYTAFKRGEVRPATHTNWAEVSTLLEYWTSFLNQDEKPDGTAISSSLRSP